MSTPLLDVKDLSVRYGAVRALEGVNVEVYPGEIVTLIGANGAGKTTFLRTVSGLVRPTSGHIRLCMDGSTASLERLRPHDVVRLGVAHAPEGRQIFSELTVDENLSLGAYLRKDRKGIAADRERVLALFPRLRERLGQPAGTLSGGEQQMLAIGRALLARPRLLLLDEPSLGLAPLLVRTIFDTIARINAQGTTVLLVEQNAHMALHVAHRAYVLETGRLRLSGDAKTLANDPAVKRAYLGD